MSLAEEKAAVRRRVLEARDGMPEEERARASGLIVEKLIELAGTAETVFAFHPFGSEPDIRPFLEAVLSSGKRLLLPRLDAGRMSLHRVEDIQALEPGPLGIKQPPAGPEAEPAEAELFVIPGVAFTARGARLGYGGGCMDRLLSRHRSRDNGSVGVCFRIQVLDSLPLEAHDLPVRRLVTEDGLSRSS